MHRSMIFFKNNGYVSISKMYYRLNQCAAAMKSLHLHLKKCKPCNFTWVIGIKYDFFRGLDEILHLKTMHRSLIFCQEHVTTRLAV